MTDLIALALTLDEHDGGSVAWDFMDAVGQVGSPLPTWPTLLDLIDNLNHTVRRLFAVALNLETA